MAFVGPHWLSQAWVGCHRFSLACIGLHGLLWAFTGHCWPNLAFTGLFWLLWVLTGLCWLSWVLVVCIGFHWLAWAFVDLNGPVLAWEQTPSIVVCHRSVIDDPIIYMYRLTIRQYLGIKPKAIFWVYKTKHLYAWLFFGHDCKVWTN